MTYELEFLTTQDHPKRSVCFLISDIKQNNVKEKFSELRKSDERALRLRFDYWINGHRDNPEHYHGWNKSEFGGKYKECFVFKKIPYRLYGFLCNPNVANPSYQLCVLVRYAKKKTNETDESELKKVETLRNTQELQKYINKLYEQYNAETLDRTQHK